MDADFAFIAGYTSGGMPFGLTWAELEEADPSFRREDGECEPPETDEDLPF